MERVIKHTYKEWWEGKIYFSGRCEFSSPEEKKVFNMKIKLANYIDLSEQDETKIKKKQKEIFLDAAKKYLKMLKSDFLKTYKNSSEKEIYVRGLIRDLENIFFNPVPNNFDFPFRCKHLRRSYLYEEIMRAKNYFQSQIINGTTYYNFIQSPNLQKEILKHFELFPLEIDTYTLHQYFNWLNKKFVKDKGTPNPDLLKRKNIPSSFSFSELINSKFKIDSTGLNGRISSMLKDLKSEKYKYVDEKTTLPNFKKIFSGEKIVVKIKWTGNVADLNLFIKTLKKLNIIEVCGKKHWQIAVNCFEGTNDRAEPLTSTMIHTAGKTNSASIIRILEIVREFSS